MRKDQDSDLQGTAETVRYINSIAKELRILAVRADLGFLAYLLAMVEDDSANLLRKTLEET